MGKSQLEQWQNAKPEDLAGGDKKRKSREEDVAAGLKQWQESDTSTDKKEEKTETEKALEKWQNS